MTRLTLIYLIYGKISLSTVVLTQNNLCKKMPALNNPTQLHRKSILNAQEIINAPIIVNITSTIAMSNTRYECTPSPGTPREFLYLHRFIIYSVNIKSIVGIAPIQ